MQFEHIPAWTEVLSLTLIQSNKYVYSTIRRCRYYKPLTVWYQSHTPIQSSVNCLNSIAIFTFSVTSFHNWASCLEGLTPFESELSNNAPMKHMLEVLCLCQTSVFCPESISDVHLKFGHIIPLQKSHLTITSTNLSSTEKTNKREKN